MTVLTKEELSVPRSAADMLPWALAAHSRFTATPALRAMARDGRGFAKQLAQEALPMARFAYRYFNASSDVLITHVLGNQTYDGVVEDKRSPIGTVRFIEVTDSTWDETEALRMELLSRDGYAPGYGKVHAQGRKGRRTRLEGETEMRDVNAHPVQHLDRVREVVCAKASRKYPDGTALVVHVDDAIRFRDSPAVAALESLALMELVPFLSGREFRVLVLEGSNGLYRAYTL